MKMYVIHIRESGSCDDDGVSLVKADSLKEAFVRVILQEEGGHLEKEDLDDWDEWMSYLEDWRDINSISDKLEIQDEYESVDETIAELSEEFDLYFKYRDE